MYEAPAFLHHLDLETESSLSLAAYLRDTSKSFHRRILESQPLDQAHLLIHAALHRPQDLATIRRGRLPFRGVDFTGLNDARHLPFDMMDCTRANFSGLDLSGANMTRAYMPDAKLIDVLLHDVDFTRGDFTRVNFKDSPISNSKGPYANFSDALDLHIVDYTNGSYLHSKFTAKAKTEMKSAYNTRLNPAGNL